MIDYKKRKKSEQWVKEKADEFTKLDTDLTFAEWCYRQGKADGRVEALDELQDKIDYEYYDGGYGDYHEVEMITRMIKESKENNDGK